MKILFTDDQEYDDENSSENIQFVLRLDGLQRVVTTISGIELHLMKTNDKPVFPVIKITAKENWKEVLAQYPISQIKRMIP